MTHLIEYAILTAVTIIPLVVMFLIRKKRIASVIIATIFFLFGIAIALVFSGGKIDDLLCAPIFVGIILFVFTLLFASGRADDFIIALKVSLGKSDADEKSLKKALIAVHLAERLVVLGALANFMIGILSLLNHLEDLSAIRPNLAITLLPIVYAVIICAALKGIIACIKAKITEFE